MLWPPRLMTPVCTQSWVGQSAASTRTPSPPEAGEAVRQFPGREAVNLLPVCGNHYGQRPSVLFPAPSGGKDNGSQQDHPQNHKPVPKGGAQFRKR